MLGWLFPRPPVSQYEKAWIEYRFAWFVDQFGARRLLDAEVIEPNEYYFPDAYFHDYSAAEAVYRQVCEFMRVNPDETRFKLWSEDDSPYELGYQPSIHPDELPTVMVAPTHLRDPQTLVSALANMIAHHVLLSHRMMTTQDVDQPLAADLLTCFAGMGIFTANSSGETGWRPQRLRGRNYLSFHEIGYALALFAWLRGEPSPEWTQYLRLDSRKSFEITTRYLRRRRDSYILPETVGVSGKRSLGELMGQLQHGTPSAKIQAMWDLGKYDDATTQIDSISRLLHHRCKDVRRVAIETIALLNVSDEAVIREVIDALSDPAYQVRFAAARALGDLQPEHELLVGELEHALNDEDSDVVVAAADALRRIGPRAASNVNTILKNLHNALIQDDISLVRSLLEALRSASSDAGQSINDYFHERAPEFRQVLIDMLYEQNDSGMIEDEYC